MKRFDLWKLSLLNVFSSPVRSLLTVLGFAIGVAAVLAVLTLGAAGQRQVRSEMDRLGINRIWLTPAGEEGIPRGTGKWLAEAIGGAATETVAFPVTVRAASGCEAEATALGMEGNALLGLKLTQGRMLNRTDQEAQSRCAVVGSRLAEKLAVRSGDVIGFAGRNYHICGVAGAAENVTSIPVEETVILPLDALCTMTGNMVSEIQLTVAGSSLHNAQRKAVWLLEKHGRTVRASTLEVQMNAASNVISTFVNVLKWVAFVCILVGGVGVMNILLVSVRERKREIGIMKSMGTTPAQICGLFLLEAMMYAVIGGFLGILLGMGLIDAAGKSIDLQANASAADCTAVFLCALLTGLVFGVAPAFRASLLACVDALRQE